MRKLIDLTGKVYGSWTVVNYAGDKQWNCVCKCGRAQAVMGSTLRGGSSTQCRMCQNNYGAAEGCSSHPLYVTWKMMLERCLNEDSISFNSYGARGIHVCYRWSCEDGFENFKIDMGVRPEGFTLDRIDFNGNYEPSNCRWADSVTQGRNKRGVKLCVEDIHTIRGWLDVGFSHSKIAKAFGVSRQLIGRIKNGLTGANIPQRTAEAE